MSIKPSATFICGIKFKDVTSSLSGESFSMKVGSFSFGLPVSASAVSKPISEIKATEDDTNINKTILSGSAKNFVYFGSLDVSAS